MWVPRGVDGVAGGGVGGGEPGPGSATSPSSVGGPTMDSEGGPVVAVVLGASEAEEARW